MIPEEIKLKLEFFVGQSEPTYSSMYLLAEKSYQLAQERIKELEEKLNKFENPPNNIDY